MNKFQEYSVQKWCKKNGWTDMFFQDGRFYALTPNTVIPQPIPESALPQNATFPAVVVDIPSGSKRVLLLSIVGGSISELQKH